MVGAPSYQLRTVWRTPGLVRDAITILDDVEAFPQWWPSVYLSVRRLSDGGLDGVGRRIALRTTGWLPYSLSWISTLTEPVSERGFAFAAEGDFTGTGRWKFEQEGPDLVLTLDWRVSVDKPVVRHLSYLLRPLFAANHRWAMARGLEGLHREMRHRKAAGPSGVWHAPRGPSFPFLRRL